MRWCECQFLGSLCRNSNASFFILDMTSYLYQYLHNLIHFRTEKENCLENTWEQDPTVFSRRSAWSNLKLKICVSIFLDSIFLKKIIFLIFFLLILDFYLFIYLFILFLKYTFLVRFPFSCPECSTTSF